MVLKANINALNIMQAAIGSLCKLMNRGVPCVLFVVKHVPKEMAYSS